MSLTDFIATLGLVLAVISLTWQAATFTLSGARIRATLKHGGERVERMIAARKVRALETGFTVIVPTS